MPKKSKKLKKSKKPIEVKAPQEQAKVESAPEFKMTLNMAGENYEGKGATILEALNNLPLDWTKVKAKGVIKLSDGKRTVEKLFYLRPLKALIAGKMKKIVWAKYFSKLLEYKSIT